MARSMISTPSAPSAIGPYSQAIKTSGLLFTSGQIPLRTDGTLVPGAIREQTRQVMENLKAVLEAGGSSLQQVVKCTCFLADMNDFVAFNEVYGEFFDAEPPARSAVQVARLPKDVAVEVEAVALVES